MSNIWTIDPICEFTNVLDTGLLSLDKIARTDVTESRVDTRIILAANVHLHATMQKGRLRENLFCRMNCVSLAGTTEDIPPLVSYMIMIAKYGDNGRETSNEALDILATYHWPGNIRELKSVIKVLIFSDSNMISDLWQGVPFGPTYPYFLIKNEKTVSYKISGGLFVYFQPQTSFPIGIVATIFVLYVKHLHLSRLCITN